MPGSWHNGIMIEDKVHHFRPNTLAAPKSSPMPVLSRTVTVGD
jgi:hypothetical protein